jgi:poly(3-hydroxyalkanoate) synthetase
MNPKEEGVTEKVVIEAVIEMIEMGATEATEKAAIGEIEITEKVVTEKGATMKVVTEKVGKEKVVTGAIVQITEIVMSKEVVDTKETEEMIEMVNQDNMIIGVIEVIEEHTEVTERRDKEEIMMVVIEEEIDQELKDEITKRDLKEPDKE